MEVSQVLDAGRDQFRLAESVGVERDISRSVEQPGDVRIGLPVPHEKELGVLDRHASANPINPMSC
jgi:hypothetical protein